MSWNPIVTKVDPYAYLASTDSIPGFNTSGMSWSDTPAAQYFHSGGTTGGRMPIQDLSAWKSWYDQTYPGQAQQILNALPMLPNDWQNNLSMLAGYYRQPDGSLVNFNDPNQMKGGDSFWKMPVIIGGAALGAGALSGALGGAGSGAIGAADLGDVGASVSSGGLGTAAGTTAGASTVGDFNIFDPSTWFSPSSTASTLGDSIGAVAPDGTIVPSAGIDPFSNTLTAGTDYNSFLQSIGIDPSSTMFSGGTMSNADILSEIGGSSGLNLPTGTQQLVQKLLQSGVSANALPSVLKSLGIDPSGILGSGLSLAAREAPGLMALDYAKSQGDKTQSIIDQIAGNRGAVIKAATDPLQANIAAGYGDLLQSQGLRGIRGSSFGNTDIANYIARTGSALANAGANAAEGSLALQAQLTNQAQANKNALYGRAFDILGRGLSPSGFGNTLSLSA